MFSIECLSGLIALYVDMFSYCELAILPRSDLVASTVTLRPPALSFYLFIHFSTTLLTLFLDGIAAATVGSIMNYLLLGLGPNLDRFYLHSFEILLACTVVFPGIGNLGFTLLEYRLGQRNFFAAMFENLRWIPFL